LIEQPAARVGGPDLVAETRGSSGHHAVGSLDQEQSGFATTRAGLQRSNTRNPR
jgi:hypothetical protein